MKKFLIAAAGLSAIAAAAPAGAQYYPGQQQVPYGYGQQQGYGQQYGQAYGYNNYDQQGLVRSYLIRADQLRRHVERLDQRNRISNNEARRLRAAAIDLQNRTRGYASNGLNDRERYDLDRRFAQLQQAARMERFDGNDRWGQGGRDYDRDGVRDRRDGWIDVNRNGIDDRREGGFDRDRDGRDDRYEDDRGRYPG